MSKKDDRKRAQDFRYRNGTRMTVKEAEKFDKKHPKTVEPTMTISRAFEEAAKEAGIPARRHGVIADMIRDDEPASSEAEEKESMTERLARLKRDVKG